jgi:hypothetical protein
MHSECLLEQKEANKTACFVCFLALFMLMNYSKAKYYIQIQT